MVASAAVIELQVLSPRCSMPRLSINYLQLHFSKMPLNLAHRSLLTFLSRIDAQEETWKVRPLTQNLRSPLILSPISIKFALSSSPPEKMTPNGPASSEQKLCDLGNVPSWKYALISALAHEFWYVVEQWWKYVSHFRSTKQMVRLTPVPSVVRTWAPK